MSIKVDPDLNLQWHDGALQLNGSVRVSHAQISPRYLPTATADESPDLVIVAGQLPSAEKSVFDRSKLRLNGSIAVELGEDVTLSLDKAKARFQGTTVFNWKNELIPTGDGSYRVTGKITAYGQSLEVSQGKISFPRVPANNPRLDIRAERQIYGNVQVKQAGVLIGGTLKRPLLEAYTRPATTEERALALLVTGHDFDYEQGVGAVEVGMYIAPKLYVSYGIGLFENDSVVSLRYDLGRGFGIKATSSQRQSGGDVTYTIER
jgi:translocation and assembly module TamB